MDISDFKICYAETMMYYQLIENDIKLIYSYMHRGNVVQHLESAENKTLGQMIRILKELDESDGKPLLFASSIDRTYLSRIESGKKNITVEMLIKICEDGLGVSVKDFFDFEKIDF